MYLCAYNQGHGKCRQQVLNSGEFCAKHAHMRPDEKGVDMLLVELIRSAKAKLDAAGAEILFRHVLNGTGEVPEDERRAWRNLHYRLQYLENYRNSRAPGTPLPAEIYAKE